MYIPLDIDDRNLTSFIVDETNRSELITSTITTTITITATTTNALLRLFNTTRIFPFLRPPPQTTTPLPLSNKFFIFQSSFNRHIRVIELGILSLTLPLYAIVFILCIQLTVLHLSKSTTISGGGSRSRSQRRREHLHSLIWTLNYLLVDFLNLLYEVAYVTIHLTASLALNSSVGRFYCQLQVYLPLYLAVLMAYSLTAVSIYRRRHFVSLNNKMTRTTSRSILLIGALWIVPIITSIVPVFLLTHLHILRITQHESTNQCQISYTYVSTSEAIYIFYRLGNIFLLPLTISFVCYLKIYVDLIRMQRSFTRAFKRHVHIRKNLISQILFLFLNFAVFWLPAEIIMLYTKNRQLRDAVQVTKSLNIFLDPLIIIAFDTRFSSAARQLLSQWRIDEFICFLSTNHQRHFSISTQPPSIRPLRQTMSLPIPPVTTWNIAENDDITVLESTSNHVSHRPRIRRPQQRPLPQRRERSTENHV